MKTRRPQFLSILGFIILIAAILFLKGPAKALGLGVAILFLVSGLAGKIMGR